MATQKLNFFQRTLLFLQGGEEANVKKTIDHAYRDWESRIETDTSSLERAKVKCVNAIADKKRSLIDDKENLSEAYMKIDATVKTNEDRKAYMKIYEKQISKAVSRVTSTEKEIETIQEDWDEKIEALTNSIVLYKSHLAELDSMKEVEVPEKASK